MKGKKIVFIGIIVLIILIVVCFVILLLSQITQTTNTTTNPTSNPVSTQVNVIDLNNSPGGAFDYAVIRPDDTIELRNKLNAKFIIGLEKREWKSIQWSPNGDLVAVLGKSTANIYDIYIYNLLQKEWSKATDYKNFETGVEDYSWVENNTILFTQGSVPNKWLHKFNYLSKETLKVSNITGEILSTSPDLKYVVIKSEESAPLIYDDSGLQAYALNNIKDAESGNLLAFNSVEFFEGSEKILAQDFFGSYYKFNLGDNVAVKTSLASDYTTVCSLTENSFNAFLNTSNSLVYGNYSSRDDLFNILGEESFKLSFTVDKDLSYCTNGEIFLKLEFADGTTQWYKQVATTLEADGVLDGNIDTDIKTK